MQPTGRVELQNDRLETLPGEIREQLIWRVARVNSSAEFVLHARSTANGMLPYQMYLKHLVSRIPEMTQQERFESPYHDYLQAPLQPLMDNLESALFDHAKKESMDSERFIAYVISEDEGGRSKPFMSG